MDTVSYETEVADLEAHPSRYTAWFMTAAPMAVRGMLGPGA